MTLATIVNQLLREGSIERVAVNRYRIKASLRTIDLGISALPANRIFTLTQIHRIFAYGGNESSPTTYGIRSRAYGPIWEEFGFPTEAPRAEVRRPEPPRPRTISRGGYHSHGNGTSRDGLDRALLAIPRDEDGVRRSFGLEWEINALTTTQEDKLARLLDTLPAHFTERDGSLNSTGVEIIFLPLGREKIIEVWNKLQSFCRENSVDMDGAGAHLTYGVSNSDISDITDLTVRLNRIALSVKAVGTQTQIRNLFGRDFTGYARLPQSTTESGHAMSWSASRGCSAYELRLCAWKGNIEKITEFMRATECVFHRPIAAQDFLKIFEIMGADTSES